MIQWPQFIKRLTCLAATLVVAGAAGRTIAAGDPAPDAESVRLVKQLGDDDSAVRLKAAWRLREIGQKALPALREAADSDDPEVQTAAKAAIKAIGSPLPQTTDGPRFDKVIQADEQYWAVEYHEGKRVVRIEGDVCQEGQPYGHLKLTFTGPVNGKKTTQVFEAENEERLKWDSPQAWMYFHKIYNHKSDMAAVRVPNNGLNAAVKEAMDRLHFSADERKEVEKGCGKFSDVSSKALATDMFEPDEAPKRLAELDRESDALRTFLTDKKLPIVEGQYEVAPPPEARLGLSFKTDHTKFPPDAQSGLLIMFAATGERADRIGVRRGDVIQRINGNEIESADQISPACRACPAGMTIDVFRDGKTINLHEKPNDTGAAKE